jgi:hypothetical protein
MLNLNGIIAQTTNVIERDPGVTDRDRVRDRRGAGPSDVGAVRTE